MAKRTGMVAALDLGTAKTCVVVGEVGERGIEVCGIGEAPSRGLRKGAIVHVESTVQAIRKAVAEAEQMARCEIRHVTASIGGSHVRGLSSHGVVAVRNGEVSVSDLSRVLDAARAVALPADREVLHVLPQEYIIDDQEGLREPIGIAGVRLEAKVHIITSQVAAAQNLVKCCKQAGIAVDDVVLGALASADAVLTPEEKELGVALVDIGAGTSDVVIFHGGAVRHTTNLPLGGQHLTNDIAAGLRTPTVEAEKIKRRFGCARAALVERHVEIEVPSVGDREPRVLSRHILCEIIEPRVEEIFQLVAREIIRSGYEEVLASGVVLVGGSVLLDRITDVAERILRLPVRIGIPHHVTALADLVASPIHAASIGLLLAGGDGGKPVRLHATRTDGLLGRVRHRMGEWLRDFF
ncbi:MAG: cell division protein FtsA [Polyangiaceae bacterium UTPRO1]|nr:cell division protein FtsA [Myxococcales bacterium]OQY66707.1 MAG: cell division protein FtsA [Polyangiaceae bacterium UTPRO1]